MVGLQEEKAVSPLQPCQPAPANLRQTGMPDETWARRQLFGQAKKALLRQQQMVELDRDRRGQTKKKESLGRKKKEKKSGGQKKRKEDRQWQCVWC